MMIFSVTVERGDHYADCYEMVDLSEGLAVLDLFNGKRRHARLYRIELEDGRTDVTTIATTAVKPRNLLKGEH